MSTIQSHNVPPRDASQCWSWTNVVLAILLAMNLQLFLMFNSKDEIAGPVNTLSNEPAWDHDKVLLRMAELQKTLWLYIPFLIMLAFSMGFMLGRQGCTWQKLQEEEIDHETANRSTNPGNNSANDMGNAEHNSETEDRPTNNGNTEGGQHEIYFGKAKIPVSAHPEHIITEMGQMVMREGEHQGRTFHQVWSIDRKKTYTKWLQSRIEKIDIAYVAFLIYAEMKDILQR